MPRLRPGDGGVRCSPKAADVVDQVVDAPMAGQRGPATTSPARSSGTRRPPERAHVHRPRVTKARSPDHTLNHASLVHHMSRPSIVRLGCSVVGVVVIGPGRRRPSPSATAPKRLTSTPAEWVHSRQQASGHGIDSRSALEPAVSDPGTPDGRRRSGCSSRDRMWAAWFWCASRSPGRSAKIAPASSWSGWGSASTRMSGSWAKPERLRGALAAGAPLDELCGTSERRMPRGAQFRTR